jgi:hypothetical protein
MQIIILQRLPNVEYNRYINSGLSCQKFFGWKQKKAFWSYPIDTKEGHKIIF